MTMIEEYVYFEQGMTKSYEICSDICEAMTIDEADGICFFCRFHVQHESRRGGLSTGDRINFPPDDLMRLSLFALEHCTSC